MDFSRLNLNSAALHPIDMRFATYTPLPEDVTILERAFNNRAERKENANKLAAAMQLSLNNLDLNPAEDAWRQDFVNKYTAPIQSLLDDGSFADAAELSLRLGTAAKTDPALRGRIRAQQEYKRKRDEVLARNDLNQVTKDRWVEENPYSYEDKFDERGNVIGGSEWKPGWNPVSRYDMTKLYANVKQLAAEEAGGAESVMFMKEDGSLTPDPSEGFYGVAVKKGGEYHRLSTSKLKNVFNALFKQSPEAMDSLMQDMKDRRWQYDKATDKEKKNFIGTDIIKEDGTFRTPEEYLMHRANPVLSEMAYNHVKSHIDYGGAYAARAKAVKDAQAKQSLLDIQGLQNNTTMTTPIEINLKDRAGRTFSTIGTALETVKNIFGDIPVYNNPHYKFLIENGNYRGLANYISKFRGKLSKDPKKQEELNSAIALLREEGDAFNAYMKGLNEDDVKAVKTYAATVAGLPLKDAKDNEYTRKIASLKNTLFSYSNPNGKRTNTNNFILVFDNDKKQSEFFASLKMTPEEMYKYGVSLTTVENKPAIVVDKNTSILTNIADANASLKRDSWFDDKPSYIVHRKPDGSVTYTKMMNGKNSNALTALSSTSSFMNNLNKKVDNIFAKSVVLNSVTPLQVMPFDDYNTQMLNKLWVSGAIEDDDYKEIKKEFEDNNLKALGFAMEHPSNYTFYGRKDKKGNVVKLTEDEAKVMARNIQIANDQGLIDISPSDAPTGKGFGTIIRIKNKNSKNEVIDSDIIYVDGLFDGPASQAVARNPELLSQHSFKQARAIRSAIRDVTGRQINYDAPDAYKKFLGSKMLDNIYNNIDERRAKGQSITEKEAEKVATELLIINSGIDENSYDFKNKIDALIKSDDFKANRDALKSKLLTY